MSALSVAQDPLDTGPTDAAGQLDAGRLELCSQSGGGLGKASQRGDSVVTGQIRCRVRVSPRAGAGELWAFTRAPVVAILSLLTPSALVARPVGKSNAYGCAHVAQG